MWLVRGNYEPDTPGHRLDAPGAVFERHLMVKASSCNAVKIRRIMPLFSSATSLTMFFFKVMLLLVYNYSALLHVIEHPVQALLTDGFCFVFLWVWKGGGRWCVLFMCVFYVWGMLFFTGVLCLALCFVMWVVDCRRRREERWSCLQSSWPALEMSNGE